MYELPILIGSGIVLLGITAYYTYESSQSIESLLAADRSVGFGQGSLSILATWTAPPAILVSSQIAFEMGLSGAFWFSVPNFLAIGLFGFVAPRIKEKVPQGYTVAQLFDTKGGRMYKLVSLYTFIFSMLLMIQAVVGGAAFLTNFADFSRTLAVFVILGIIAAYSLISGLKASILTDVIQISVLGVLLAVIVPWTVFVGGGVQAASSYVAPGNWGSILATDALLFGLHLSIILFVAPIIGLQYWQRVYAIKPKAVAKSHFAAGALFAFVPISLSVLGFMAADGVSGVTVEQPILAGYEVMNAVLPVSAGIVAFMLLVTALLSSADSGLVGSTSVLVVDLLDTILERDIEETLATRGSMLVLILLAGVLAILPVSLLDWLLLNAPIGVVLIPPVIAKLYFDQDIDPDRMFNASLVGSIVVFPSYVYTSLQAEMGLRVGALVLGGVVTSALLAYYHSRAGDVRPAAAD